MGLYREVNESKEWYRLKLLYFYVFFFISFFYGLGLEFSRSYVEFFLIYYGVLFLEVGEFVLIYGSSKGVNSR